MHLSTPRLRNLLKRFACLIAVVLAIAAPQGAYAKDPDIVVRPGQGSCGNYRGGLRLVVSATPNLGGIEPTTLIAEDTTVHLYGHSEDLRLNGQCDVVSRTPVPFQWRLIYRNPAGGETDATSQLGNSGSLTPTFMASEPGVFFAVLTAKQQSVTARIEVIRRGHGWVSIGPSGLAEGADDYSSVGRINQIAFNPAHPSTVYAAAGRAGVFKSISSGRDWISVTDHKGLAFASTSAVTVSQAGTVFVGLGDIRGNGPIDAEDDEGSLWRSEDGGTTWADASGMGCATSSGRIQTKVNKIWVSRTDTQRVLAATRAGLWRSTDGAHCWEVVPGLDTGEFTDLDVDPRFGFGAGILWVAKKGARPGAGVAFVDRVWDASPTVGTFYSPSDDDVGWAVIARAPSNPLTVYFAIATADGKKAYLIRNHANEAGFPMREIANSSVCEDDQCNYNLALAVHPLDERHVLFGAVRPSHSTNAGADFDGLADNRSAHDDFHALVFPPGNFNEVFAATDGGVYRLTFSGTFYADPGSSWEPRNAYLNNANTGTLTNSPSHSEHVASGMWDSGTLARTAGRRWQLLRRGDGVFTSYDAGSDEVLYFHWNAGFSASTYSFPHRKYLGQPAGFAANPYVPGELWGWRVSPFDNTGGFVWQGANATFTFAPSFVGEWKCADPAPSHDRWLSAVDFTSDGHYFSAGNDGTVYRFTLGRELRQSCDDAKGVENVEVVFRSSGADCVNVSVDPARSDIAYVVAPGSAGENRVVKVSRDNRPDGEGTWTVTPIAANLPADVRLAQTGAAPAMAADPSLPGVIYVGSTRGVFVGTPSGTGTYAWQKELDVPDVYISMIHAHRNLAGYSGVVRLASYGRGIWERRITNPCAPASVCVGQIRHMPCMACRTAAAEVLGLRSAMQASMGVPIPSSLVAGGATPVYLLATPTKAGKPLPYFLAIAPLITKQPSGIALVDLTFVPPQSGPLGIVTDGLLLQWVDEHGRTLGKQAVQPWMLSWRANESNILRVEAFESGPSRLLTRRAVQLTLNDQPQNYETPFEVALAKGTKVQLAWSLSERDGGREAQPVECFLNGRRAKDVTIALSELSQDTVLSCHFEGEEAAPELKGDRK
jgi:hypothetical protein